MTFKDENYDSSGYVKVNERLLEFRDKYPEGLITTFRIKEEDGVSFKTVVFRSIKEADSFAVTSIAPADGYSFISNESRQNQEKSEEYAETVSVGRALAKLGFKITKSIATSEEMEQYERNKSSKPSSNNSSKLSSDFSDSGKSGLNYEVGATEQPLVESDTKEASEVESGATEQPLVEPETKEASEEESKDQPKLKISRPFNRGAGFNVE